jgi:L-lactate dehydrogenase complex protein LldF
MRSSLNPALEAAGITPIETDLAELIIQLGARSALAHRRPGAAQATAARSARFSCARCTWPDLGDDPKDLAAAARRYLREKFLRAPRRRQRRELLIAETGGVCVVESEGNGRMCLTLPRRP